LIVKRGLAILIFGILIFEITGCAHHIQIQKDFVAEAQLLPELNMTSPVSIVVKAHDLTGEVEFCNALMAKCWVNYSDLADYAVQSMVDIFNRNHVRVMDGAEKKLTVSIARASCDEEVNGIKFNMDIDVTAGEEPTRTFSGYQRSWSAHGFNFSVTAAVLNAVIEMFEDKEIKHYLEGRQ